jgi:TolA-binding protein
MQSSEAAVPATVREQATYRLGVCEFELKRFREAADLFEQFIDAFPESPLVASASFYCGEALFTLGRYERAVEHLTRIAEDFREDPVYGPSLLRLGESLATLQRWARSERVFTEYLEGFREAPHRYQAHFGVGWAREHQQRHDEAISAYRQVVGDHQGPTAARAQFQIGECLFAKQQYEDAVRELLKVDILYAYPEWSAAALYEAGRCFGKLGKLGEARAHFRQVADQYGDSRWAELASQELSTMSGAGLPGK